MSVTLDDPLIARMSITRTLPLDESGRGRHRLVGVVDPTLRALPDDKFHGLRAHQGPHRRPPERGRARDVGGASQSPRSGRCSTSW